MSAPDPKRHWSDRNLVGCGVFLAGCVAAWAALIALAVGSARAFEWLWGLVA